MPRVSEMLESKYLKKEDVGEDGVICTVSGFERVNVAMDDQPPEHKWVMRLKEFEKPMVLNSTNLQLCEKAFGSDNTDDWMGKKIIVYSDPNIAFGGKLVGGIRVKSTRTAGPPRQAGNGRDDFADDSMFDNGLDEQDIRAAALRGTAALKEAWGKLSAASQDELRPKLPNFKDIAANVTVAAQRPPAPAHVDPLDGDVPF